MKQFWQTKNISDGIIDVDMSKRTVSGYFARFDNIDSDGDIIKRGSFVKSVAETGPSGTNRIKHLKNHNPNQMIGRITELREDAQGLYFTSILSSNSHGKDALIEYQEKLLTEHSIGFQTLQSDQDAMEGANVISEIKLWEGSAVTWGANSETPVTNIKSLKGLDINELYKRLDDVVKVSKIGELSDDKLASVEININFIKQAIKEKLEEMPSREGIDTLPPDADERLFEVFTNFRRDLERSMKL